MVQNMAHTRTKRSTALCSPTKDMSRTAELSNDRDTLIVGIHDARMGTVPQPGNSDDPPPHLQQ